MNIKEIISKHRLPNLEIGEQIKMKFLYCGGLFEPILDIPYFFMENGKRYVVLYSYKILKIDENDYIHDTIRIKNIKLKKFEDVDKRIISYYNCFKYTFEEKIENINNVKEELKKCASLIKGEEEYKEIIEAINKLETKYEMNHLIERIEYALQEVGVYPCNVEFKEIYNTLYVLNNL